MVLYDYTDFNTLRARQAVINLRGRHRKDWFGDGKLFEWRQLLFEFVGSSGDRLRQAIRRSKI